MGLKTALLSTVLGLQLGLPVSHAFFANSQSVYDPLTYNVVYDLKALYGDSDGDGKLTEQEYQDFDIDRLAPEEGALDQSFRFLGFNPASDDRMVFYLFSDSDRITADDAVYLLSYRNSVTPSSDGQGYQNDVVKYSSATLLNTYSSVRGTFCKFLVSDYVPMKNGDSMRIEAVSFQEMSGGKTVLEKSIDDSELFYSSDYSSGILNTYFAGHTYRITGVVDMMLATTEQVSSQSHFFFIPLEEKQTYVSEAREIPYFFFDFDDSEFKVDEIQSVTYQYYMNYFTHTHYYRSTISMKDGKFGDPSSGWEGIYTGRYGDTQETLEGYKYDVKLGEVDKTGYDDLTWTTYSDRADVYRTEFRKATTHSGITEIRQTDKLVGWGDISPVVRKYQIGNIVNVANLDSDFPESETTSEFRKFIKADDHLKYSWAYGILDSDYRRKVTGQDTVQTTNVYNFGLLTAETNSIYRTTTDCHQPKDNSIVTLSMHVRQKDRDFDINVINDPQSVRKVYMVGLPAPSVTEFIVNDITADISNWLTSNPWIWAIAGFVVLMIILGFIVRLVRWAKGGSKKRNRR